MTKKITQSHKWTKAEIKILISLWTSKTLEEVAKEIGVSSAQILYMVREIRKAGHEMPKKKRNGIKRGLIMEALGELDIDFTHKH